MITSSRNDDGADVYLFYIVFCIIGNDFFPLFTLKYPEADVMFCEGWLHIHQLYSTRSIKFNLNLKIAMALSGAVQKAGEQSTSFEMLKSQVLDVTKLNLKANLIPTVSQFTGQSTLSHKFNFPPSWRIKKEKKKFL